MKDEDEIYKGKVENYPEPNKPIKVYENSALQKTRKKNNIDGGKRRSNKKQTKKRHSSKRMKRKTRKHRRRSLALRARSRRKH